MPTQATGQPENARRLRVFLSHSSADKLAVRALYERLRAEGFIEPWLDEEELLPGQDWRQETEKAVRAADVVLVCLSRSSVDQAGTIQREIRLALDLAKEQPENTISVIPVKLEVCSLPDQLGHLHPVNLFEERGYEQLSRGLNYRAGTIPRHTVASTRRSRIFISYDQSAAVDATLALRLDAALQQAGHVVFVDRNAQGGFEWVNQIRQQIETSNFVLVLLSEASVQSEMIAKEIEVAYEHHQRTGKSQLLPIRINFADYLPYQIGYYLDHLPYVYWQSEEPDQRLIEQLLTAVNQGVFFSSQMPTLVDRTQHAAAMKAPPPYADPRFIETLREPDGTVKLGSSFYIERVADEQLNRELRKPHGTTTTIRASRQTGKSSLLIRGVAAAQKHGRKTVLIVLQPIEERYLQSLDAFLHYIITVIVTKLRLDPAEVARAWQGPLGAPDKATYLMEDYILPQTEASVVLAIDEADQLLQTPFHATFFGLLRFWHNSRAMNELWDKLDLVLVISTEPHLLISDFTQSPFNVGLKIRLEDFDAAQVQALNRRYRSPLDAQDLPALMDFLNGHPYLTSRALYTLVTAGITWEELRRTACDNHSPFNDHLRRYLWMLQDQPQLRKALKQIIRRGDCSDEFVYYRLLQAGLIKGTSSKACQCRCRLYEDYLKDQI